MILSISLRTERLGWRSSHKGTRTPTDSTQRLNNNWKICYMPRSKPRTQSPDAASLSALAETARLSGDHEFANSLAERVWVLKTLAKVIDTICPLGAKEPHLQRLQKSLQIAAKWHCYQIEEPQL